MLAWAADQCHVEGKACALRACAMFESGRIRCARGDVSKGGQGRALGEGDERG
jgi:hypothetical protein